eukprot:1143257-Pelagomonas_calceolata.AAC.7
MHITQECVVIKTVTAHRRKDNCVVKISSCFLRRGIQVEEKNLAEKKKGTQQENTGGQTGGQRHLPCLPGNPGESCGAWTWCAQSSRPGSPSCKKKEGT